MQVIKQMFHPKQIKHLLALACLTPSLLFAQQSTAPTMQAINNYFSTIAMAPNNERMYFVTYNYPSINYIDLYTAKSYSLLNYVGGTDLLISSDSKIGYLLNADLQLINLENRELIKKVELPHQSPSKLFLNPETHQLYITYAHKKQIDIMDTDNPGFLESIEISDTRKPPCGLEKIDGFLDMVKDPNRPLLYLADFSNRSIATFDLTTNQINLNQSRIATHCPTTLAMDPVHQKLFVASYYAPQVDIIDLVTNQVIATLAVGKNPRRIVLKPDYSKAYVINAGSNNVTVIDTAQNRVMRTIESDRFDKPWSGAFSPGGYKLYVFNDNTLNAAVVNTFTDMVFAVIGK